MAFDQTKKKACSRSVTAFALFLLVFIVLIASHFSSVSRIDLQNQFTVRDQNRPIRPALAVQSDPQPTYLTPPAPLPPRIACDRSHFRYDLCSINGPAVLDPRTATMFSSGPYRPMMKIKPYPRKWERFIMAGIREVTLATGPMGPSCQVHHDSPALVFSAGGYTGNFFHDIGDGILPLFITVNYLSLNDGDVILVINKPRDWWVSKYADVIRAFTKHPIINLDNDTSTHCFTSASVGLVSHGFMALDPKALPSPLSLAHFQTFLRNVFGREGEVIKHHHSPTKRKPKLVWVGRTGSVGRVIVNQEEARLVAEEVGFNVEIFKPTKRLLLRDAYEVLNGSHAMIGVHGAALTHLFLLRPGSVLVQVVPLGLEWAAAECFGRPAREVGLEYMAYKVDLEESSLMGKYSKEDPILKDSEGSQRKGWDGKVMDVYLREQDVKLDLVRFRGYMEKVYEKAKSFMDTHG